MKAPGLHKRAVYSMAIACLVVLAAAGTAFVVRRDRSRADAAAIRATANGYAQHGQLYHAISGFELLIRRDPNDADAWQRVGLLYRATGQLGRSWDALSTAARLNPQDYLSRTALGMLAPHLGKLTEADSLLRQVLDRDPGNPDALTAHASLLIRLDPSGRGLKQAEQEIDRAISVRKSGPAYDIRGQVHRAQRRFKEAVQDFRDAIAVEPRARSHYLFLSQCYAALGDSAMAREVMAQYEKLPRARQPVDVPAGDRAGHTQ